MKALSLWQPYASLIAAGVKKIETRSWPTRYRGPLAIHAARKEDGDIALDCYDALEHPAASARLAVLGITAFEHFPRGCIVAVATLKDCVSMDAYDFPMPAPHSDERAFGHYASGRYGWILTDVRPLATPLPVRGAQGLWELDDALLPAELRP